MISSFKFIKINETDSLILILFAVSTLSVHAGELAVAQPRESTYSSSSNDSDSDSCSEEDIPTTFRGRSASEHSHNISCLHAVEEVNDYHHLSLLGILFLS